MLTLQQAQDAITERLHPAVAVEPVAVRQALGRFTAAEVRARVDNPAFDNSAMDGYACRSTDLTSRHQRLPLQGESRCGSAPGMLAPGTAMRIFTGAPLPAGADAVAMQEDITLENGIALFPSSIVSGTHVRRRAEDFRADELLYARGRRLSAYDLALLAAAGIERVQVYARPRVLVIATGDELVARAHPLSRARYTNRIAWRPWYNSNNWARTRWTAAP